MLEIDYSLVALDEPDRAAIVADVARKLKAGVVPVLDKSRPGRVIVLNPDPVQTSHHVPDELRMQLRRGMVNTTEGSSTLRADRLFAEIVSGEEPLAALIIEVQSDFQAFPEFLDYIPVLRAKYPDCAVFLNGTAPNIMEKMRQVLAAGRATAMISYSDARGTIDIEDPKELSQAVAQKEDAITFGYPFFSQVRLMIEKGAKPLAINFDSLKRLHPMFGQGEAKEVDLGGGKKDKVFIIDIPMRVVRDLQFRQDRGLEFHGIVQNKRTVLSRHFDQEKLELKWIPIKSIEAFLRKAPGRDIERVDVGKAKVMRVNCFNGQVSFLMTHLGNQISLEDAQLLAIRKSYAPRLKLPEGYSPPLGTTQTVIHFDKLVLPGAKITRLEPIQQAVQEHYYGRQLIAEATILRKQEVYARRLKVGAVGPLAGQTLKLLRRFGLERLIDPGSFYYLCDQPSQLPTYHVTHQRYGVHFATLIKQIKEIAAIGEHHHLRLSDINHRLPICTEWIDAEAVSFERVSPEDLDTVYHELNTLGSFIAQEFQSNFDVSREDLVFFEKMRVSRQAGLLAKWLSEYKRGSYGATLRVNEYPDVVFLGTAEDKKENDERFFFPALACSELFQDPANQKLFSKIDYEFSVFLEEQLAVGDHQARQEGHTKPGYEQIARHFEARLKETEAQRETLNEQAMKLDAVDSPEYLLLLKEEEEAYHQRYKAYLLDKEKVAHTHRDLDVQFFDLVRKLLPVLALPADPDPGWLAGGEPDPVCVDRPILAALRTRRQQLQGELDRNIGIVTARIREALTLCHEISAAKLQLLQTHRQWQNATLQAGLAEGVRQATKASSDRIALARRTQAGDLDNHLKRTQTQLTDIEGELKSGEARMVQAQRDQARTLQQVQATVTGLLSHAEKASARSGTDPGTGLNQATVLAQKATQVARLLAGLKSKRDDWVRLSEGNFLRRQRLAVRRYELSVDVSILKALSESRTPQPPVPNLAEPASSPQSFEETFRNQAAHLDALHPRLDELCRALPLQVERVRHQLRVFLQLAAQREELEKLSARKVRLRETAESLAERSRIMDEELADLPTRMRERFMPARKKLLIDVFIPETQKRVYYFRQAQAFLAELLNLPYERVRQLYQDRAIFRRFSSAQFLHGLQITHDVMVASAEGLRNVNAGINQFFRSLQYNYGKYHPERANYLKLDKVEMMEPSRILARLRQLPPDAGPDTPSYVILPSTLSVREALKLMNQKDAMFRGVPRVVAVYISKFDMAPLQDNPGLRDEYFQALKHNVIVNIDDRKVVDNPRTIALQLLNDTLGCTMDTARVDEIPEEDPTQAQAIRG